MTCNNRSDRFISAQDSLGTLKFVYDTCTKVQRLRSCCFLRKKFCNEIINKWVRKRKLFFFVSFENYFRFLKWEPSSSSYLFVDYFLIHLVHYEALSNQDQPQKLLVCQSNYLQNYLQDGVQACKYYQEQDGLGRKWVILN